MKKALPKAVCTSCNEAFFSTAFNDSGNHYCPECGSALKISNEIYQLVKEADWQPSRQLSSYHRNKSKVPSG